MHKKYFPKCKVEGPIEPAVPYDHMASVGAIPQKCSRCEYLFEGSCIRYLEEVGRYLNLDHGPCKVNGPTDPVYYISKHLKSKVEIPGKCHECRLLEIDRFHGLHCAENKQKWGDFLRGFDWGTWEPDVIYFELPLPKITNQKLNDLANKNDCVNFIKEHRRVNPELSFKEAKNDFIYLRKKLMIKL